jgi:uncharacterized membrane protein YbhN (UPF0104 family)
MATIPSFFASAFPLGGALSQAEAALWQIVRQVWTPSHVLLAVGCVLAVVAVRTFLVRRELSRRKTFELRPYDEFDPSPQDIATFALRLDRLRRRLPARFLKSSQAVTVTLGGSAGVLTHTLTLPSSGEGVLRSAMFDRVEIATPDSPVATAGPASALAPASYLEIPSASALPDERLGDLSRNDSEDEPGWREEEA